MQFTSQFLDKFKKNNATESKQREKFLISAKNWLKLLPLLIILIPFGEIITRLLVEWFWFQEVNYQGVWLKRLITQLGLGGGVFLISALFLGINFNLAQKLQFTDSEEDSPSKLVLGKMNLRSLLIVIGLICLLISLMLIHYLQVSVYLIESGFNLPLLENIVDISGLSENYEVNNLNPFLSSPFKLQLVKPLLERVMTSQWQILLILAIFAILLMRISFWLKSFAVIINVFFTVTIALNWTKVLPFLYRTNFELFDPLFNKDIGFYIFSLPIWELLDFWLGGLFLYSLLAVSLMYLCSGNSISDGKFPGFSYPQLRHLYTLGGMVFLTLSLRHGLARYELLYSERGAIYGASYTDVQVQLPIETLLSIVAAVTAVWLFWHALTHSMRFRIKGRSHWLGFILYIGAVILGITLSPIAQRFEVLPNELEREQPYIERSIQLTRAAFGLDQIEEQRFDPEDTLTREEVEANQQTISNIRLWDARPLLQTNRQLQQIRLYYEFADADIDRYTLRVNIDDPENVSKRTERQQMIIAPRELDFNSVPKQAQTWVNKHLVYTHGYGFTLSPVNQVGEGGLPKYFIKDIGTGQEEAAGDLRTKSPQIRDSIPIGKPRIYYGELTDNYVMIQTKQPELDFPTGEDNAYNTYDGKGGIPIGSWWRRSIFAQYLKDWQMLFTQNFTPETKLLMRRDIKERVKAIAPFLQFDSDPYLVTADTEDTALGPPENSLHWVIDAYTISDRYPYSDPGSYRFNYIRNSVKVVVDAYDGDVQFYIADLNDPIIQSWEKVFPNLFQPLWQMPITLKAHIRYPVDLFKVQSERLLTYHMIDPQVFYNREDQWQIPQEIYANEARSVEPYYLTMKLPTEQREEFILLLPFTPTERNNLTAWLAGRSDGQFYGKQLLYQFPKQRLIFGPEQIEALINQDPVISQQISLWNQQGSRAIQGNLLVIPIEQSLLYVEPVYLEAERNSLPTLIRVIVVYENRIVMAKTLQGAIDAIFLPEDSDTPAIIRPVEEVTPSLEIETQE
ncbi:UPF0182 family protein [Dactylococcopsis salina]|uniref:UPF0182 protein Dacsa_3042 n=1 Tax=Dactylococcopsis salina (strain PCC 8305) TaxID=13035 RepID=K9YZ18_DACS8|nr:UPF0182 family protein [Dactylococcopsis salina]AFZ51575.1 hypothetical protein Dacsa_3042 [Dactylococcopsis salina PCC 8305]